MFINKGFIPKRDRDQRLPPGQYKTSDFPVLALGPSPHLTHEEWNLEITGLVKRSIKWNWDEFNKLPQTQITADIHCVTKWSKFDTNWKGVSFDEILKIVEPKDSAEYILAYSYDGYSTNIPLNEIIGKQCIVALSYEGKDLEAVHGGPARIVLPHLYFWKSAKWVNKIEFLDHDEMGFWETRGYNNHGNPWLEERYS